MNSCHGDNFYDPAGSPTLGDSVMTWSPAVIWTVWKGWRVLTALLRTREPLRFGSSLPLATSRKRPSVLMASHKGRLSWSFVRRTAPAGFVGLGHG